MSNKNVKIQKGDALLCIFDEPLPGKKHRPDLVKGLRYKCDNIFTDSKGNDHIDVGLPLEIGEVTSFATGETLPDNCHWCHPNRFVVVS